MSEHWHSLSEKEIYHQLQTELNGLSLEEVQKRLSLYGFNEPTKRKEKNPFWLLLEQFRSPLIYLLLVSAVITYFLQYRLDTLVILAIVIVNALVGFLQELKAEKSLEALKKLLSLQTKVIREAEEYEIPAKNLVIGDIVILESGVKVPADLRLIKTEDLKIDESSLTGESIPVHKNFKILPEKTCLADRVNMAYASTLVTVGYGLGIVVQTGGKTEIGQIAKELVGIDERNTPLHQNISKFSRTLLIITIISSSMVFLIGFLQGRDILNIFLTSVAAAVSIIPEGLPAIITITLSVGVWRMVKKQAIIRRLQAIETLGLITVIASDKTGTLTHNQMTVEKIYLANKKYLKVSGKGYQPEGFFYHLNKPIKTQSLPDLQKILLVAVLCNNASLIQEESEWKILGDPTEGSLLTLSSKAGCHKEKLAARYPRLDEIPFDSDKQYMATLHENYLKNKTLIAVKGTLEKVLDSTGFYLTNGRIKKITRKYKKNVLDAAGKEASQAHRIIAFAYRPMPRYYQKISQKDISKLVYLGFLAIDDPPREEALEAIAKCRLSGIRPIMITGDHPATALAIAQRVGISTNNGAYLTELDLEKLTDHQLQKQIANISIFARITPKTKLRIVDNLQQLNQIVAVTGDGVNDAPVLKKADVGIAMGQGGTDVAIEAADVVLVNNNFSTILSAIEEGRTIFLNIRRAIFYLLSTNLGELMILISALFLGLPIPLSPVQILWINLVTDSASGLSLAMEKKHAEVNGLPPRSRSEGILDTTSLRRMIVVAITMTIITIYLYTTELNNGASLERARSIAFVAMAVLQIFNLPNARSMKLSVFKLNLFSNPYVVWAFLGSLMLTIFTTQTSVLRNLFNTVPLKPTDWIIIILVSLSVIMAVELDKYIYNKLKLKYNKKLLKV